VRSGRALAALWIAAALAVACAQILTPPASDEERRAYAQALSTRTDDPQATERALEGFVATYPDSPLADDAHMQLAEIALERGKTEVTLERYYVVVRKHPQGDRAHAARVEIARLELARGDREAAAAMVRRASLSRLSSAERRVAFRVLADTARDPIEELRWLARVRASETDPDAVALVDVEIDERVVQLDRPELLRASEQLGGEIPAARVLLHVAELALDQGDAQQAQRALDRAAKLPLAPAYEGRLTSVTDRLRLREMGSLDIELPTFREAAERPLPTTAGARGTLGVVLPLTGRFAGFGEESLQGVLLAAGVFGEDDLGKRVRVLVRDSAGRPERAAAAVHELAEAGVVAIVGPLLSGECESAAEAAEADGVPMLALTAREEVSASRPHVFRVRTMPSEEVEALVDHAVHRLDARRFAILYPRDAYGRGLRRLFWEEVEEQGGRIVAIASYEPEATDFAEPIRRLLGYQLLSADEKAAIARRQQLEERARRLPAQEAAALREQAKQMTGPDGEPLPPVVDFDALFIPESHERVVLIAPQLAFHEAVGARLLGPNGWNDPDLVKIGRDHVEGARFTAMFYPDSSLPGVKDFTERYDRAFASSPDAFAAQAFDATNLVLMQLSRGRDSREKVREGVLSVTGYPGVTGVLTMRADGNARKRPFLLAVERGHIQQVE